MYEELIAKLRAEEIPLDELVRLLHEAADVIEELQAQLMYSNEKVPKWNSVTQRLPKAKPGYTSKPVLVTDGDCMAIAELFNSESCEPYWSYTGIGDITHWQPLPKMPKEET